MDPEFFEIFPVLSTLSRKDDFPTSIPMGRLMRNNLFIPGVEANTFVYEGSAGLVPSPDIIYEDSADLVSPPDTADIIDLPIPLPTKWSPFGEEGLIRDSGYGSGSSGAIGQAGTLSQYIQGSDYCDRRSEVELGYRCVSGPNGDLEFKRGVGRRSCSDTASSQGSNPYPHNPSTNLPRELTTRPGTTGPAAYLLKHEQSGNGVLLGSDGQPLQVVPMQRQTYFGDITFLHPVPYAHYGCCADHGAGSQDQEKCSYNISYVEPGLDAGQPQLNINPIRGMSGIPQLSTDIIPAFDMGHYAHILQLPDRAEDVIVYFNSICSCAALASGQIDWVQESFVETKFLFDGLDDCIFQMCEALNKERLVDQENRLVYGYLVFETRCGHRMPAVTAVREWWETIENARRYLRRLYSLAYGHALHKGRVEAVWRAIGQYRDNWANELFSASIDDSWEITEDHVEEIKLYHFFNREVQRLLMGAEKDLFLVGRLQNIITAFAGSVFKAQEKWDEVAGRFQALLLRSPGFDSF
ncbi:hypothetical protein DRE_06447 [Drechslerella stenobrocha 248]|uniref:Uncharacterized protein n=1 Tax=Drechslerella stenobrocha 248 TaxID=1043628 RepID=W7HNU6_9PEZI|nr:hypothetical protein DRE_06447 [Drechslerella stenobrocha 248]